MVGILIIIALVVLMCVGTAQFLGKEIVALIVGSDEANRMMEGKVDNIKIGEEDEWDESDETREPEGSE